MADTLVADREDLVAAERHQLLDDNGARQDDVGPLGLETAHATTLADGERLQPLAQRRDVLVPQPKPVERGAVTVDGSQEDAAERAQAAAETDQRVAGVGAGQPSRRRRVSRRSACISRARGGSCLKNRTVVRTAPSGTLATRAIRPARTRVT